MIRKAHEYPNHKATVPQVEQIVYEYSVDDVPNHDGEYCIRTFWDGELIGNSWRHGEEARDEHIAELKEDGYEFRDTPFPVKRTPTWWT